MNNSTNIKYSSTTKRTHFENSTWKSDISEQ